MHDRAKELLGRLKTYYQNNHRKIRMLIIAVVTLGIVNYMAQWFTSMPRLCGSCHQIYPTLDSWRQSIHSGVACKSCHPLPGIAGATKRVYLQFTAYNRPGSPKIHINDRDSVHQVCEQCHSSNRTVAVGGGLFIPHDKHRENGIGCTTCHARVVHGEGGEKTRKPKMDTCMKCHNGERAPEGCGVCHMTIPDPTNDYYYHPDQRIIK